MTKLLLVRRSTPEAGTPGVRMGSASCSCARRSYAGTRRRQRRTFPFLRFDTLNPSASMRALQDEDNCKAPARLSIDNCGWDPGKDEVEDRLSDCETVFACPDYDDDWSTFDDGINVPGLADASNHRDWDPGLDF